MTENEQPNEPTVQELTQIGAAGAKAVDPETQTPEQARTAVATAVREEARELRVTIEPSTIDAIATATISKLEAMGAFRKPEPVTQNTEGSGAEQTQVEQQQSAATPPEKKTWAQKILG